MIRVIVNGAMGKMGRTTCAAVVAEDDLELAAAVDPAFGGAGAETGAAPAIDGVPAGVPAFATLADAFAQAEADVAVDFTTPSSVFDNVTACLEAGLHCVVGTTGISPEQLAQIESLTRSTGANCFVAPNFAIGGVLMMEMARAVVRHMPSCEIIELHHDQKLDAPSGTALRTADLIAEERGEAAVEPAGPEGHPARGLIHKGIPIHSVRLPGLVAHQEVVFGGPGQTLSIRHDSISRESFMPGVVLAIRQVGFIDGLVIGLEKIM